jgi:hypothetical protein
MSNRTSHHIWEQGIIQLMNLDGWELEWTGEEFEHYDAKGKTPKGFDCVIEFKLRHAYYQTKILEKFKYDKLMAMNCMKFYYVFDSGGNYLYHLDTLKVPKPVNITCKTTEKFNRTDLMDKECYMLSESQASIFNKYEKIVYKI